MTKSQKISRENMLDKLYRRKEIIENERDETFHIEELKEIKNEIKYYEDEIKEEIKMMRLSKIEND